MVNHKHPNRFKGVITTFYELYTIDKNLTYFNCKTDICMKFDLFDFFQNRIRDEELIEKNNDEINNSKEHVDIFNTLFKTF